MPKKKKKEEEEDEEEEEEKITGQLEEIQGSFAPALAVEELSSITRTAEDFPTVSPPETKQSHPGNGHPAAIEDPASRRFLPHQRWSPHLASKQPPPPQTSPPSPLLDLTIYISKVRPAFANYELISEAPIASSAVP